MELDIYVAPYYWTAVVDRIGLLYNCGFGISSRVLAMVICEHVT